MPNEAVYNMRSALEYEKSWQPRADLFYKQRYPGMNIWRPSYETHKAWQQADVDVVVGDPAGDKWPNELKISEKFRSQNWPDVLIEIYDDIDKERKSWGLKSGAEWHYYFHEYKWKSLPSIKIGNNGIDTEEPEEHDESFVRIVPTWAIRKMSEMCAVMFTETFKDMRESNVRHREAMLDDEVITLLLVPTKVNDKIAYFTACACVPQDLFKKFYHIEIEEHKLPELCNLPESRSEIEES